MEPIVVAHDLSFRKMISAEKIQERIEALGRQISRRHAGRRPIFLPVLNGAFVFAADLVRACAIDCEVSFIKLQSYRGMQSGGELIRRIGLEDSVAGRPVIIVEDIIDSGKTLSRFLPELERENPASIEIAALLVKPEAMEYELDIHYAGFEIPPRFVIGYGLDYDGLGRNLPHIYELKD